MSTSDTSATEDRARDFIDDVLKINFDYGMRSVPGQEAYEAAVASATRWASQHLVK
jgi:hypothetical protein